MAKNDNKKEMFFRVLKDIDSLIDTDPSKAQELLDIVNNNTDYNKFSIQKKYLQNRIKEKRIYNSYDEKTKKNYDECVKTGSELYNQVYVKNKFQKSLECYYKGKRTTKHPIFNYYIGKLQYKLHNYVIAEKYLLNYIENGGEKLGKAYLYLFLMSYRTGNNKDTVLYLDCIDKLDMTFNDGNFNKSKTRKIINNTKERYGKNSKNKKKNNIKVNNNESLKLQQAEKLIQSNNEKQADAILNELFNNTLSDEVKKQVQYIKRNKSLIKRKSKYLD